MLALVATLALLLGNAPASAQSDPSTARARARIVAIQRTERARVQDHEPPAAIGLDVTGAILTMGGVLALSIGLIVACAGCDRASTSPGERDAFAAAMVGAGAIGAGLVLFLVAAGLHLDARSRRAHRGGRISLAPGSDDIELGFVIPFDG